MNPGLCRACRFAKIVANRRGSEFWLCRAAADSPRLRRYPPLPVLQCEAWAPGSPGRELDHEVDQELEPGQKQASEDCRLESTDAEPRRERPDDPEHQRVDQPDEQPQGKNRQRD